MHRHHGAQCGFCTPGMVVCAIDMLENAPPTGLDEKALRQGLAGNICRCKGYQNIVAAISEVATARAATARRGATA